MILRTILNIAAFCLITSLTGCGWFPRTASEDPGGREVLVEIEPPPTEPQQQSALIQAGAIKDSGDYEKALELFREILQDNPSITTATEAYVGIGEIHKLKGDYAKAEPAYARAAKFSPRNFDAQYGHGVVLQLLGRLVEAIKAFHRAVTIEPDNLDANRSMAAAYLENSEPQSAIPFAEKAVSLKPDDGPTRVNLGAAYEQIGRTADADHAI
jgi:tetratricopeptide (TPR) repeat protein